MIRKILEAVDIPLVPRAKDLQMLEDYLKTHGWTPGPFGEISFAGLVYREWTGPYERFVITVYETRFGESIRDEVEGHANKVELDIEALPLIPKTDDEYRGTDQQMSLYRPARKHLNDIIHIMARKNNLKYTRKKS